MVCSEFSLTFKTNKTVRITFGFNCRNKDHYGIMMYHRNRLIKAYDLLHMELSTDTFPAPLLAVQTRPRGAVPLSDFQGQQLCCLVLRLLPAQAAS